MFKLTALLTTLALGASASAAMAAPVRAYARASDAGSRRVERSRIDRSRVTYNHAAFDDQRRGALDDFGARRYRPTWVALSAPLQLGRTGGGSIQVTDRNTFTQLRLQSAGATARIDRVVVRFADGSDQVAEADRVLDGDQLFEIALDGNNRRIECVTVIGDGRRSGAVEVFGI